MANLVHQNKIKELGRVVIGKKRLKAALVVLDAFKSKFPKTKECIDNTLKEKCEKD